MEWFVMAGHRPEDPGERSPAARKRGLRRRAGSTAACPGACSRAVPSESPAFPGPDRARGPQPPWAAQSGSIDPPAAWAGPADAAGVRADCFPVPGAPRRGVCRNLPRAAKIRCGVELSADVDRAIDAHERLAFKK